MKTFLVRNILLVLKVIGGIVAVAAISFGILLLFITITEYRPQAQEPAEIIGETALTEETVALAKPIDIISWNIGYCGLGAKHDFFMDGGTMVRPSDKKEVEENLAGVIETLKRYPSDFYFIQEMDKSSKRRRLPRRLVRRLPILIILRRRMYRIQFPQSEKWRAESAFLRDTPLRRPIVLRCRYRLSGRSVRLI